jgi:hypothetical protein
VNVLLRLQRWVPLFIDRQVIEWLARVPFPDPRGNEFRS